MALPVPFHGLIDQKFEYARNLNFGPKGAHVPNFERAPDLKTGPRFRKSSKFGAKVQNFKCNRNLKFGLKIQNCSKFGAKLPNLKCSQHFNSSPNFKTALNLEPKCQIQNALKI